MSSQWTTDPLDLADDCAQLIKSVILLVAMGQDIKKKYYPKISSQNFSLQPHFLL